MKKILFIAMVLVAAMSSCTKENVPSPEKLIDPSEYIGFWTVDGYVAQYPLVSLEFTQDSVFMNHQSYGVLSYSIDYVSSSAHYNGLYSIEIYESGNAMKVDRSKNRRELKLNLTKR